MIFVVLTEATSNGNTFLFYEEVLNELRMRYGVSKEIFDDVISINNTEKYEVFIEENELNGKRFYLE